MNIKDTVKKTEKLAFGQIKLNFSVTFFIFKAAKFILQRSTYWKYIVKSVLVNIVAFVGVILVIAGSLFAIVQVFLGSIDFQLDTLWNVFIFFLFLLPGLLIAVLLFNSIASVLNAPIYDAMTEKILNEYHLEELETYHGTLDGVYKMWGSISFELKKIILSVGFFVFSSLLNLIPGVGNALYVFLTTLNMIIANGLGVFDPALSRNHVRFRSKVNFIVENPSIWGFLILSGMVNAIPILNFFTIPLTIVASAMIYVEVLNADRGLSKLVK